MTAALRDVTKTKMLHLHLACYKLTNVNVTFTLGMLHFYSCKSRRARGQGTQNKRHQRQTRPTTGDSRGAATEPAQGRDERSGAALGHGIPCAGAGADLLLAHHGRPRLALGTLGLGTQAASPPALGNFKHIAKPRNSMKAASRLGGRAI